MSWPFSDAQNTLVFTSKDIVNSGKWIHYVSHDADDGAWQFHSIDGPPQDESDARLVLFKNIVKLDPTIAQLADLPIGWCASREAPDSEWKKQVKG